MKFKHACAALATTVTLATGTITCAAPALAAPGIHLNKDLGSIDSNSSQPGRGNGSSATAWFERQDQGIQRALIVVAVLQTIGLLLGPVRSVLFNIFRV
ncbi:hypothetical protein [Corynebacterium sp. HS2168-gen11]|uniref:hypothetical protein n=1 Tax=Corynebacterium sp. HS2168-gen11 TaxID=2974027 RepID=UPI00216B5976|nr:hypothetical protein [Corynebacterium sp. HS2168-gen11]MCS4535069.1 hypothetical protein [Corynebacterium sp. HS2168-gen11]